MKDKKAMKKLKNVVEETTGIKPSDVLVFAYNQDNNDSLAMIEGDGNRLSGTIATQMDSNETINKIINLAVFAVTADKLTNGNEE